MPANAQTIGDKGAFTGQTLNNTKFHGKPGGKTNYDGMRVQNFSTGGSPGYMVNQQTVDSISTQQGAMTAESSMSGVGLNMIPKTGSNTFHFMTEGLWSGNAVESDNLTPALIASGLLSSSKTLSIYDMGGTAGGPIKKDKVWFFSSLRNYGTDTQFAGLFFNATQGTPVYTPDLSRPADFPEHTVSPAFRMTWQVSPKVKVNLFEDIQHYTNASGGGTNTGNAPEAFFGWNVWPTGIVQGTWTMVATSKLQFEAGGAAVIFHWPYTLKQGVSPTDISILELSTNQRYNAPINPYVPATHYTDRYDQRFSVTYATGSHAFKVGVTDEEGVINNTNVSLGPSGYPVQYQFLNGKPSSLVEWALPYTELDRQKLELGLFAQDQWTLKRVTLSYGLRFDWVNAYVPAESAPAGPLTPARSFAQLNNVENWKDLSPRFGASYDLFGDGKTAVKASIGRYLVQTGSTFIAADNPMTTSINSVTRTWADTNGNFTPDCNLVNPAQNGECGPISNNNFGLSNPKATQFAQDVTNGYGVRGYFWEYGVEVQRQLGAKASLTGGYYHNWVGNYTTTNNTSVTPADYSPFCVTAPIDPRLPNGGGYQVCGLYDVSPAKFNSVTSVVTQGSQFASSSANNCGSTLNVGTPALASYDVCGKNDFFTLNVNGRFGSGIRVGGGVDFGRTVNNSCFVVNSPQQLLDCNQVIPFSAQLQVKMNATYPLPFPGRFTLSGSLQNVPGPPILATDAVANSQIAPSLGRNLSACGTLATCTATASVPLIVPYSEFEPRRNQVDVRLTKEIRLGDRARLTAKFAVYNLLNSSAILSINTTYGNHSGQQWLQPLSILGPRLAQFSAQLDF